MIRLTRLDNSAIHINPDLIEAIEETPDTVVRLSTGNHFIVMEPMTVINDRIIAFKAAIIRRGFRPPGPRYLERIRRLQAPLSCRLERDRPMTGG
jgi:flagellar protein FlbD